MEAPTMQELDALRYSELQRLAKRAGLRANLKADRLLKALKKHFHPGSDADLTSDDSDGNSTLTDKLQSSLEMEEQISVCHVIHRRGRGGKKLQQESSSKEKSNSSNEVQVSEKESTQEIINEKKDLEEMSGSANKQRKRKRTGCEIPDDATKIPTKSKTKATISAPPGGKIPRYTGRLSKSGSKPSTPNFKKLHEAHFQKMESIDRYVERKRKRLEAVSISIQEVKKSLHSKPSPSSWKSPLPSAKTPSSQRRSGRSSVASRSILVEKTAFKPTTFSTSKMNVRFSEGTKDNEHKRSLIKTPARRSSPFVPFSPNGDIIGKIVQEPDAVTTPMKFTAQTVTTPNTNKKLKFDLQASLTRPLGYQPHRGKLKPWREAKENQAAVKSSVSVLKNTYKQPPLPTRDDRRKQHEKERKCKREKAVGARRGIACP
ncbi:nucleolar and spindle-associated protein 1 [Pseudophryne corroboree]|uniref:nucleolar and spindle-associated protein 1 n=1 Tax=Pseudophryne corroboree TaxID=495146 RepID=UPI003081B199